MTKILARSAGVLDEADRFQKILEWQLFCMEQETALWGYNPEVDWVPGNPIYRDPRTGGDRSRFSYDFLAEEGPLGNCVRPMVEILDDDFYRSTRCEDCEVSWGFHDGDECWMCGKEYPRPSMPVFQNSFLSGVVSANEIRQSMEFELRPVRPQPIGHITHFSEDDRGLYVTFDVEQTVMMGLQLELGQRWREQMQLYMDNMSIGMAQVGQSLRRFGESFGGLSTHFSIIDEFHTMTFNPVRIEPFRSVRKTSPFERAEFKEPIWGTAALYDPHAKPVRGRVTLPANLDLSGRREPVLPQMPELNVNYEELSEQASWERMIKPITQQRRRRE